MAIYKGRKASRRLQFEAKQKSDLKFYIQKNIKERILEMKKKKRLKFLQ